MGARSGRGAFEFPIRNRHPALPWVASPVNETAQTMRVVGRMNLMRQA
jgi:hypothetical protein